MLCAAAPSSPPDSVTASANSSTSITVTWDMVPAIDQNGIITMHEVLYQPLETFGGLISTQTLNASGLERSIMLINLQEFVNYNISVRAYTSVGNGPYSSEVTALTLQDGEYSP